jgi:hypothetical protein
MLRCLDWSQCRLESFWFNLEMLCYQVEPAQRVLLARCWSLVELLLRVEVMWRSCPEAAQGQQRALVEYYVWAQVQAHKVGCFDWTVVSVAAVLVVQ